MAGVGTQAVERGKQGVGHGRLGAGNGRLGAGHGRLGLVAGISGVEDGGRCQWLWAGRQMTWSFSEWSEPSRPDQTPVDMGRKMSAMSLESFPLILLTFPLFL